MQLDTYATLLNKKLVVPSKKSHYLAVDRAWLAAILESHLVRIAFDERWYISHSPDVADAIGRGEFASALDHYLTVGYYENRMPYEIPVDEPWYLDAYADIAAAVRAGLFASGAEHFYKLGFREGRCPHPGFVLRNI